MRLIRLSARRNQGSMPALCSRHNMRRASPLARLEFEPTAKPSGGAVAWRLMPSLNGADGCAEVTRLRFLGCDAIPLTFPIRWCPFDLGHPPWSSLRFPRYVAVGKIRCSDQNRRLFRWRKPERTGNQVACKVVALGSIGWTKGFRSIPRLVIRAVFGGTYSFESGDTAKTRGKVCQVALAPPST